jgi:hypothetical protein
MMQKLPQRMFRILFHYHLDENWMNGELQGFCAIWHNVDALYVCQGVAQPIFSWLVLVGNSGSISFAYHRTHYENLTAIILLLISCWISECYVANNFCKMSCNRIFRHFHPLSEKWV